MAITPFDTEEEALELANGVKYGLAAYVWTNDLKRAHTFAQTIEAGMVWLNSHNVRDLRTPFGGVKASGLGHEGGYRSIDFYTDQQAVHITLGDVHTARFGSSPLPHDRPGRHREPLKETAMTTPPDIVRSAYAEYIVTDLAASRAFYVDVLGLVVTYEDENALYLRAFEEYLHHSIILRKGPVAALAAHRLPGALPARGRGRRRVLPRAGLPGRAPRRPAPPGASARRCASRTRWVSRSSSSTTPSTSSGSRAATTCTAPGPSPGSTTST